jgi:hypothetical protein
VTEIEKRSFYTSPAVLSFSVDFLDLEFIVKYYALTQTRRKAPWKNRL